MDASKVVKGKKRGERSSIYWGFKGKAKYLHVFSVEMHKEKNECF